MSLSSHKNLEVMLDETLRILSNETIRREIDDRIDIAYMTFNYSLTPVSENSQALIQAMGDFVAHIYRHGLRFPLALSNKQACNEALYLLEHGYRGLGGDGFEGALRDSEKYGKEQLRMILMTLTTVIKEVQRQQYKRWVLEHCVLSLNRDIKQQLVTLVLDRWGIYLEQELVERFADDPANACLEILLSDVGSTHELRQVFGAAI